MSEGDDNLASLSFREKIALLNKKPLNINNNNSEFKKNSNNNNKNNFNKEVNKIAQKQSLIQSKQFPSTSTLSPTPVSTSFVRRPSSPPLSTQLPLATIQSVQNQRFPPPPPPPLSQLPLATIPSVQNQLSHQTPPPADKNTSMSANIPRSNSMNRNFNWIPLIPSNSLFFMLPGEFQRGDSEYRKIDLSRIPKDPNKPPEQLQITQSDIDRLSIYMS